MHTIEHSESILTVFPHCSLWNTYYILIYLMKKMHRGAREWDRTATTKTTTTHSASRREWNERDEQMHSVRHCFRLCCSSNPYFRPLFIYFMDFFLLLVLILILFFSQFCALILAPNRLWMLYYTTLNLVWNVCHMHTIPSILSLSFLIEIHNEKQQEKSLDQMHKWHPFIHRKSLTLISPATHFFSLRFALWLSAAHSDWKGPISFFTHFLTLSSDFCTTLSFAIHQNSFPSIASQRNGMKPMA